MLTILELSPIMLEHQSNTFDPARVMSVYGGYFVGEFPSKQGYPMNIYYTPERHPKFGNHYFGLFSSRSGILPNSIMICNGDWVETITGMGILDKDGKLIYSTHQHDYRKFDGGFVDGGLEYLRYGFSDNDNPPQVVEFTVRDGCFVLLENKSD